MATKRTYQPSKTRRVKTHGFREKNGNKKRTRCFESSSCQGPCPFGGFRNQLKKSGNRRFFYKFLKIKKDQKFGRFFI